MSVCEHVLMSASAHRCPRKQMPLQLNLEGTVRHLG